MKTAWGLRLLQALSLVVFVLSVGLTLLGIPPRLADLNLNKDNFFPLISGEAVVAYTISLDILLAALFFVSSAVVAWQKPRQPSAWFLLLALSALGATETSMTDALINPDLNPSGVQWTVLVMALRSLAMASGLVLLYVFPDGRFTPAWTLPLAWGWIGLNILWFWLPTLPFNPNHGPTWRATPTASLLFGLAWFGSGILAQGMRVLRTSDPIQHEQSKWAAYGLSAAVCGGVVFYGYIAMKDVFPILVEGRILGTLYVTLRPLAKFLGMGLLPLCLGVASLRYGLFDINILINRTLVYGSLTGLLGALYLSLVAGVSFLTQAQDTTLAAMLAAAVVSLLFQPLRQRLQHWVSRLLFGERDDPYQLVSQLGQQLSLPAEPETALKQIAAIIGRGLKLPCVALATPMAQGWQIQAIYQANLPGNTIDLAEGDWLPMVELAARPGWQAQIDYQGALAGLLWVSPRLADATFSRADQRTLGELARQLGPILQAARLHTELLNAHARLVTAREEERRRLQRDLHDGLGPTLASLTLQVDAAASLLRRDPERAAVVLETVAAQTHDLIGSVRQMVYGLRPPALDELGLLATLRARLAQSSAPGLQISFHAPESLPPLPAAVETAAYQIVLGAVTNVVRHAQARRCQVTLELGGRALKITVVDDGVGIGAHPAGIGIQTMRERAVELGGSFAVEALHGSGTCLQAHLPLIDISQTGLKDGSDE